MANLSQTIFQQYTKITRVFQTEGEKVESILLLKICFSFH